jgi:hypothetical protein
LRNRKATHMRPVPDSRDARSDDEKANLVVCKTAVGNARLRQTRFSPANAGRGPFAGKCFRSRRRARPEPPAPEPCGSRHRQLLRWSQRCASSPNRPSRRLSNRRARPPRTAISRGDRWVPDLGASRRNWHRTRTRANVSSLPARQSVSRRPLTCLFLASHYCVTRTNDAGGSHREVRVHRGVARPAQRVDPAVPVSVLALDARS